MDELSLYHVFYSIEHWKLHTMKYIAKSQLFVVEVKKTPQSIRSICIGTAKNLLESICHLVVLLSITATRKGSVTVVVPPQNFRSSGANFSVPSFRNYLVFGHCFGCSLVVVKWGGCWAIYHFYFGIEEFLLLLYLYLKLELVSHNFLVPVVSCYFFT